MKRGTMNENVKNKGERKGEKERLTVGDSEGTLAFSSGYPSQQGSWSIKAVLPAAVPELDYSQLDGVQDGGMAMEAFLEAVHPDTPEERRRLLREQLLAYCRLDTYAMVRLWQVFSGRSDLSGGIEGGSV